MTSLGEVYHGQGDGDVGHGRLYAGTGLFLVGAILVVAGIVVATTDVIRSGGASLLQVREYGGILAGVGVPAVFLGIFAVLPSSRNTKAAAGIGASIAVLGVALFTHAYPCKWSGAQCAAGLPNLTLPTVGVYFLGTITTFWCLFVGVANFKTRNDPGGTVTMEVTRQGETRVVEVDRKELQQGSVGVSGGVNQGSAGLTDAHVSDGGASANDIQSPLDASGDGGAEVMSGSSGTRGGANAGGSRASAGRGAASHDGVTGGRASGSPSASGAKWSSSTQADRYCGSCKHFEYVQTDRGIQPYCGYHDGLMEDMDACGQWTSRSE
ncbi:MAG: ribonuclease BN [Haloferacaceae archaeon]